MSSAEASATVPGSPPATALRQEFRDFDDFAETILGWGLDWVQLDRGPLNAMLQQLATSATLLTRIRFSRKFHQRGSNPPGTRTFGFIAPTSPHMEWRGQEGSGRNIVVFPPHDDFECVSHPGFHGDTLSVAEDRLYSVAEVLGVSGLFEDLPDHQAILEVDQDRIEEVRRLMTRAHTRLAPLQGDPTIEPALAEIDFEVVAALVLALVTGRNSDVRPPKPALRGRAVKSALDYIEAHADEPPTIEEICRASGASWRTLNYAFRERFGVTPKCYLQLVRLQRVRHELLRREVETSVSETAAGWGFWHMGDFAADYRRQFGELPSETIRR